MGAPCHVLIRATRSKGTQAEGSSDVWGTAFDAGSRFVVSLVLDMFCNRSYAHLQADKPVRDRRGRPQSL